MEEGDPAGLKTEDEAKPRVGIALEEDLAGAGAGAGAVRVKSEDADADGERDALRELELSGGLGAQAKA